jgi:hypothetical protein
MEKKVCSKCKMSYPKTAEYFVKDSSRPDGLYPSCKKCDKKRRKKLDRGKRAYQARRTKIAMTYGLTEDDVRQIMDEQRGCCKICGDSLCSGFREYSIDHCHDTGKIRGLLCSHCNSGIGYLKDNPLLCRLAANYLEESL